MDKPYTLKYSHRNLPHWLVADHSYFVTLRLKGSLPKNVIAGFRAHRDVSDEAEALELAAKAVRFFRADSGFGCKCPMVGGSKCGFHCLEQS